MRDDYPLRLGDRRFRGPLKYVIIVAVLTAVTFLYLAVNRWLEQKSVDALGDPYDRGHPFPDRTS